MIVCVGWVVYVRRRCLWIASVPAVAPTPYWISVLAFLISSLCTCTSTLAANRLSVVFVSMGLSPPVAFFLMASCVVRIALSVSCGTLPSMMR
eukprot:6596790-Prorocentrum_lima.AAC.1